METFTIFIFWVLAAQFMCKLLFFSFLKYPRRPKMTLGLEIADTLSIIVVMFWAGNLLW